jgi:hypothetical protein
MKNINYEDLPEKEPTIGTIDNKEQKDSQEKNEKLSTERLYRIAVKTGRKLISEGVSIEEIRDFMKEKGLNKIDTETAINIMACMLFFDSKVFPNAKKKTSFQFAYGGKEEESTSEQKSIAAYNHLDDGYQVAIKNVLKNLKNDASRIVYFTNNGKPIKEIYNQFPKAKIKESIMAMAAHEVRHRLQFNGIKMFEKGEIYKNILVDSYVYSVEKDFENGYEPGYSDLEPLEKQREFDSRIIENMTLWAVHEGIELRDLLKIIKMEGVPAEVQSENSIEKEEIKEIKKRLGIID